MLRFALLSAAVLALAGSSTTDSYTFRQRGTVPTPRAALHDGQPLERSVRLEGHMSTTMSSAVEAEAQPGQPVGASGAAVARNQAGGAIRFKAGQLADLGLEVDSSWAPTSVTRDGAPIGAPDDAAIGVALAVRGTTHATSEGMRLGWVMNLGAESAPILRDGNTRARRDEAFLFRAALVPSIKRGAVTLFGSLGFSSESDIASSITVYDSSDDPGVDAEATGAIFAAAAGATVDLGSGARATARIGDAFGDENHYGPQVDVGLSFDIGN